ncbi:MAG: glycosyltransferase [Chloroflexota bacterium]
MLDFVILGIAGVLLVLLVTMILNLLIFPQLKADDSPAQHPRVSILIPARNETVVIENTVRHLLAQTYPHFEILILDDHSDDGTGDLARQVADGDSRLTVLTGETIPDGWMGKSWACELLGQQASGEILIFTDADVIWEENALNSILTQLQTSGADMVTVWSTQVTTTWSERLTVPNIAMAILGYLPTVMVHHSPFSLFGAANGQMMAWRREVYEALGGHEIVANNVLDDVTMAKMAKKRGYRIRMVDGNEQISTRMYEDWQSVRNGFAKNILAGYGGVIPLLLGTIFHWMIFVFPYILLFLPDYRVMGMVLILAGFSLRAASAKFTHQRVFDTILMPITVVLFTIISAQSIYWHFTGGPVWKGRKLGKDNKWKNPPSSSVAASAD